MSKCETRNCSCTTTPVLPPEPSTPGANREVYRIENMDCPTEEALIRDKLARLPGVLALEFNLVQRTLVVTHELPSPEPLEAVLAAMGMQAQRQRPAKILTSVLRIAKMDCPTEEALIRGKLAGMSDVTNMEFNLIQRTLTLQHASSALPSVLAALKSLGLEAQVQGATVTETVLAPIESAKTNWWPMVLSGVSATAAEVVFWWNDGFHWSVAALALLAIFTGGLSTYKKGFIALRNRNLNMNALMSIAVTGAILIGQWPEAAMVMFLFALAEVIEVKSLDRVRNAIRGLMALAPETATVRQSDGSWLEIGRTLQTPENAGLNRGLSLSHLSQTAGVARMPQPWPDTQVD